jgi:large subunit ribosomal protein L23
MENTSTENQKKKWQELIGLTRFPTMIDLVKSPVITERNYRALTFESKYTFDVDKRLTKPQIKKLFENLFHVNIIRINTLIPPKQSIRFARSSGFKPLYKRVILTLKKGQSINYYCTYNKK